jgi:hypothetical protein
LEVLVAGDTCLERQDWMKRAIFLATAALVAMLILMPLMPRAKAQYADAGTTLYAGGDGSPSASGSPSPPLTPLEDTGGPALVLPAAVLLLGSGILTYAILRRR